jgi:hypothetical protein
LRCEAKNGRALHGRDIYLRDERDQVTGQLSTVVVRSVVFLKKSVSSGISPSAIFVAPRVGEEEVVIVVLSVPESCPESSTLADEAMRAAGHEQWC